MDITTFNLFIQVISAAREGRFMFGNGAQWYIVDHAGRKWMYDTSIGTRTLVPDYEGTPRTDMGMAIRLEEFLLATKSEELFTRLVDYREAKAMVRDALRGGNLIFTNGGQWYIEIGGGVAVVDLSTKVSGTWARYSVMSRHGSWKYLRENTGRVQTTEDLERFFAAA